MDYKDFKKFVYATTFESAFKLGEIALENKDFEGAILNFTQALEFNPNSLEANAHKLLCLFALNRFEACIPIGEKLILIEPDKERNYVTLANCYMELKEYDKAEIILQKLLASTRKTI
ncbi:tetratricopeptide repeat protein [Flavobacterium phycosphaerae]|uniref:tetratricopeptide repeat protein n=1 Tax=Flavobacterium phycosphaerae TaxID=2697515 RepID=UPI00138B0FFB|nr:tetratricopeptide repeat protein [Flavobacterium phycosphaerae]